MSVCHQGQFVMLFKSTIMTNLGNQDIVFFWQLHHLLMMLQLYFRESILKVLSCYCWFLSYFAYEYKRKCVSGSCSCINSELKCTDACVNQKDESIAFNEIELYTLVILIFAGIIFCDFRSFCPKSRKFVPFSRKCTVFLSTFQNVLFYYQDIKLTLKKT